MSQANLNKYDDRGQYAALVIFSVLLHAAVVFGLPEGEARAVTNVSKRRVQARLIAPPPPPPPKVEDPKPVETKPEPPKPKPKPKVVAKKAQKAQARKGRKKRRPARTLTAKNADAIPSEQAPVAVVNPEPGKLGAVTDLGDWDPDATDEEVDRDFDDSAVESEEFVPAKVETVLKSRKATCKRCKKPVFPEDSTAVLPARVVLSVLVRADGTVSEVSVVLGDDELLNEAAKQALLSSLFNPAIKNGVEVSDRIPFTVEFK
ncbi:MAG: energy transducer TonB [Myxococcota bacterium]|nr:energy transducer TonB [Myxococcota bacterium]